MAMASPERGGPMANMAKHNPQLVEASMQRANKFYEWDSQLTQADRRKLASYFWQKMTVFPLLGLPVMWGFIVAPNYLKKRNFLDPKKRYRLLQFGLGFVGLGVGFQFSGAVSSVIHLQLLKSNEPARNAYSALRRYPPQLGTRYYSMTAAKPEMAMKRPDTIDWNNNPLFPVVLVMNRDVIDRFKKAETERHDRYRKMQESSKQEEIKRRNNNSPANELSDGEPELTGTSWDSVIQRNRELNEQNTPKEFPRESSRESSRGPPLTRPTGSSWDAVIQRNQPSNQPSPRGNRQSGDPQSGEDNELLERQRKFDAMIEQTREQTLHDDFTDDIVKDDFTDSEKKWE